MSVTHEIPTFQLGEEITDEQREFLDRHGFIKFGGVVSREEIAAVLRSLEEVQQRFIDERRHKVYGIPVKYGTAQGGERFVQRFAFTSMFSDVVRDLVLDERFEPVRRLVGQDARVGHEEKDGVVVNHYVNLESSRYKNLGWHTDGLRDIAYGRLPGPMWNVGLYLDDSPLEKGGLRLIPGSHKQGLFSMAFGKLYFLDHREDPREICVEAKAGDLTVHDGRLWHRVAQASVSGEASRRRIMYVPYLTGPYEPKSEQSATPFYHRLQRLAGMGSDRV